MVQVTKLTSAVVAAGLFASAAAHPGEHHDHHHVRRQIDAREVRAHAAKRALDSCNSSAKHQALNARSHARRAKVARELREKRSIASKPQKYRRDLATLEEFETVNHNMTGVYDYSINTPESVIFGANTSCILAPEVTDGPYYVVGELIRKNVKEDKYSDGVDLYLEVQYIDIETCEPVPDVYVDIWNANATGVYSGIYTSGNYAADGLNSTYLRGIQSTDQDGVVAFETIFPGHYDGRATHTHLLAHMNVTVYPNNTIADGNNITHIGQLFWDEDLRTAVEDTYPYTTNTQAVTSNADDMWDIVQADTYYDPFPEYVYLGPDVTDGLLAWIQIGINTSVNYIDDDYYSVAAYYQADGGHENEDSAIGGGSGGNGTTNGTMTGAVPSGTPPS
ncbi:putative gpi anchored [Botryosphaeria dothidea]|uniref:Putative gpi anchored n=1 Tax=Botryosphaeria dothidea TaxID=55169 RepID=A0A8H4IGT3_9PEZI|nr:putative gpi anchored [Botryosphaeria dothidea]KAF4305066.1 putative gpi anchored [Botryosphaeria dothidea]